MSSSSSRDATASTDSNPYRLSQLLPAGTITVGATSDVDLPNVLLATDGWHMLDADYVASYITEQADTALLHWLKYLAFELFLAATCKPCSFPAHEQTDSHRFCVQIRVYLIPFDLPNVQGALKRRSSQTLSRARECMRQVLPLVVQDASLWHGTLTARCLQADNLFSVDKFDASDAGKPRNPQQILKSARGTLLPLERDPRTMAELYSDLPSPVVSPNARSHPAVEAVICGDAIPGIRTELYPYQRVSVAAMMERELSDTTSGSGESESRQPGPALTPNPLYVTLRAMDGRSFFYQPETLEILSESPLVEQCRGGVLCEELGTGKTLMILSLILATLNNLPSPEASITDERLVLTPVALRAFPSANFADLRKRAREGSRAYGTPTGAENRVPTLVETLLHYISVFPDALDLSGSAEKFESTGFWPLLSANTPFYYHFEEEVGNIGREKRRRANPVPKTMYLSAATLVIVPPNLVDQWKREIYKHCKDNAFRLLAVDGETALPAPPELASKYDLILMSTTRFCAEEPKKDVSKLHSWNLCACAPFPGTSVPHCTCETGHPQVSPLLSVRWCRLVIDEGHNSASIATRLTPFAKLLSVERRWIVTGTPTTNLLGLSFGVSPMAQSGSQESVSDIDSTEESNSPELENTADIRAECGGEGRPIRVWTKDDRSDLNKLGIMAEHFLGVPLFARSPKLFGHQVISPLMGRDGPWPGAIKVLTQVMQSVMIRHQIVDVEEHVNLPPRTHEIVLLDMHPHAVKFYNMIQALIAINAVDSERTDQDWFFHKDNKSSLMGVINNLSQTLFWRTDAHAPATIREALSRQAEVQEKAIRLSASVSDIDLLKKARQHLKSAAGDEEWAAVQAMEDVHFEVRNISRLLLESWTRLPRSLMANDQPNGTVDGILHPDRLLRLKQHVIRQPLSNAKQLALLGNLLAQEDIENSLAYQEQVRRMKASRRKIVEDEGSRRLTTFQPWTPEKIKEIQKELAAMEQAHEPESIRKTAMMDSTFTSASSSELLARSPIMGVCIGRSSSTKLNFILHEIRQHSKDEKFLIFSESVMTLSHIVEALDVLGIPHLQYTTRTSQRVRAQAVLTFETSDTYRVFLMELRHSARGLNLIAASRVIFCEPVWQADVESQAIKRAHRIGQTRPISVKILAIRGTAEEFMVARREALFKRSSAGIKPPGSWLEEAGMRQFIANPTFIEYEANSPDLGPNLNIPLVPIPDIKANEDDDVMRFAPNEQSVASKRPGICEQTAASTPRKKAKGVRFAP